MLRRSLVVLAKQTEKRTIVRDPRKRAVPSVQESQPPTEIEPPPQNRQPLPFEPSQQNQQSVGSTLGSYAIMGAGVALGFAFIGALFGG